jgi:hypothetical protein
MQVHHVTLYGTAELRAFLGCAKWRSQIPVCSLRFYAKQRRIGWIKPQNGSGIQRLTFTRTCTNCGLLLFKNHKRIFSIVDEPPLWSDADDSLESMSDPEEDEGDMPDDKDSTRSGVGEGHADAG